MNYSGWQALYGVYCIGTNKLSIYRRYLGIVACILLSATAEARYPDFVNTPPDKLSCADSGVVHITPESVGSQGYIIDTPGTYCVTGDIAFEPDRPGRSALTIKANQVTVLLENVTLSQKGNVADTNGIFIDEAVEASIFGVHIEGFTGNGIYASKAGALLLDSITSSNNKGKDSNGFLLENSDGIFIMLCNAHNNANNGISITGMNGLGTAPRVIMERSFAKNNKSGEDIHFS